MGSQWDKWIIVKVAIILISYMRQLLSLNTQFSAHSSTNLTRYCANFQKGVNLLSGELRKFSNWNWLPNKSNTLRTWENSVRNLCRTPNAMLSHWYFSEMLRWLPSKRAINTCCCLLYGFSNTRHISVLPECNFRAISNCGCFKSDQSFWPGLHRVFCLPGYSTGINSWWIHILGCPKAWQRIGYVLQVSSLLFQTRMKEMFCSPSLVP